MLGLQILVGHLFGDFLLQNDYLAAGKKRSSWICALHVALYTLGVYMLTCRHVEYEWTLLAAIAVPHFLIDRWNFVPWYMHQIGQDRFAKNLGPWSTIVVDQCLHLLCLQAAFYAALSWKDV